MTDASEPADDPAADGADLDVAEQFQVSNEFAQVQVRKVYTDKGERIELESPKLGYSIRIDPIALESLTWQDASLFSDLLETPYGPE